MNEVWVKTTETKLEIIILGGRFEERGNMGT